MVGVEGTATTPRITLWPANQRGQPRGLADSRPGKTQRPSRTLTMAHSEIDEEVSIRRQGASLSINSTVEPSSAIDYVVVCMPLQQMHPI